VRLLIVEDSALIRCVTRPAFPPAVHELVEAENGRQALDLLDRTLQPASGRLNPSDRPLPSAGHGIHAP
jgi:CheY-like chemotaxis protein